MDHLYHIHDERRWVKSLQKASVAREGDNRRREVFGSWVGVAVPIVASSEGDGKGMGGIRGW